MGKYFLFIRPTSWEIFGQFYTRACQIRLYHRYNMQQKLLKKCSTFSWDVLPFN